MLVIFHSSINMFITFSYLFMNISGIEMGYIYKRKLFFPIGYGGGIFLFLFIKFCHALIIISLDIISFVFIFRLYCCHQFIYPYCIFIILHRNIIIPKIHKTLKLQWFNNDYLLS